MAVKTNITINIVEPGSSTPVDPISVDPTTNTTTDISVPDTGLFTHGIGAPEATIIVSVVLVTVLVILSIVLTTYMHRKHKKQGRTTKLVHLADSTKTVVKSKKRITIGLSIIALLVSVCTFTAFMLNTNNSNTSAIEGNDTEQQTGNTEQTENTNNLTINAESKELTIEVKDQPVFAVLPVQVTVEEATKAGYTLTAYTDNTDLVSTTNPNNKISMVAVEGDELTSLKDNTWGLALDNEPEAKDNKVYKALSTDQTNPTIIKTIDDYSETEANDTTTIYYGFYITPDIPYGTYTGGEVEYEVTQNRTDLATVIFDGNGLYFDNNEFSTTNVIKYGREVTDKTELYSHTPNLNDAGEIIDNSWPNQMYPIETSETLVYEFSNANKVRVNIVKTDNDGCPNDQNDYFTFWAGNYSNYTAKNYETTNPVLAFGNTTGKYVFGDYNSVQTDVDGNTVTFAYTTGPASGSRGCCSGYGYYAIITATDTGGNPAYAIDSVKYAGTYKTPTTEKYDNYEFLGWSTDPEATNAIYKDISDIDANLPLNKGEKITLYAVWSPVVNISYDGNNATVGSMESTPYNGSKIILTHNNVIVGNKISLYAPNYKKEGYGFAGWSADQNAWEDLTDGEEENNPTIYGPNQSFTMTKDMAIEIAETGKDTFYAVWVPVEKNNNVPITLQNWTGCSSLTPTQYNTETGQLIVSKNTITALTDSRDGNIYTVARLADGNCWMTENLRLDNSEPNMGTTSELSQQNTHNPSLPLTNNHQEQATSNRLPTSSNSWCNDPYSASCNNQAYLNSSNINIGGQDVIASYNNGYFDVKAPQWYSYGNYYNWYSATAGNGTLSTRSGVTVVGDICPAGWMLPIDNGTDSKGSFSLLSISMGGTVDRVNSNNIRSFPNNFVYSGYLSGSYMASRSSYGFYWSSTGSQSSSSSQTFDAHSLYLNSDMGSIGGGSRKYEGLSVRCVTPVD